MVRIEKVIVGVVCLVIVPQLLNAQGIADGLHGLQQTLDQVYDEMTPLFSNLTGVGRGIAGFAATFYIGHRVWRHIANAEPIDFYPLFRPFVLGFCVLIWPSCVALINGIFQPTVSVTNEQLQNSDKAIAVLLQQKEDAVKQSPVWQMYVGPEGNGDRDKWYSYTHPDDPTGANEGFFESIGNDIRFAFAKASYNFRNAIKQWMSEMLQIFYEAAALCINTIRTFNLIVLGIIGPLVFGMAVFDGFQHSLTMYLARYINIFLWLPLANIFGTIIGKVQEQMIKLDISQIQNTGDTFFSATDAAYLVFLIIGIIGYFTIPSVANHIINAGGSNPILYKVTNLFSSSSRTILSSTGNAVSSTFGGMTSSSTASTSDNSSGGRGLFSTGESWSSGGTRSAHGFLGNKLSGNDETKS